MEFQQNSCLLARSHVVINKEIRNRMGPEEMLTDAVNKKKLL